MNKITDVAIYLINEYKKITTQDIDELKLHKLLYFAQREKIAIYNKPMFKENFEAWKFGYVNRSVRKLYKKNINELLSTKKLNAEDKNIIYNIIYQYGIYDSWKLSDLSHKEISWINARKGLKENENGHNKVLLEDIFEDAKKIRIYDSLYDMYYDEFDDFVVEKVD